MRLVRLPHCRGCLAAVLALAALAGCDRDPATNFSQYPGFAAYFAANPPSDDLPDAADRELLDRHVPRFFLAPGEMPPIDFYADYVAHGRLYDGKGGLVAAEIDRALLNRWKNDPTAVFVHDRPAGVQVEAPVVYGRIDRESVELGDAGDREAHSFTFLTYNLVFEVSGLPAGLPAWAAAGAALVASTTDWHQLDHYTAASVALDETEAPVAVTIQQHNMQRTYVLGAGMTLPADGRIMLAIARRSNELFPWTNTPNAWRTVNFPSASNMRWLVMGADAPWPRADDLTEPGQEIVTQLAFLPPSDAFYTFQGWLGEQRLLPGRSGPLGADYNALPDLKPRGLQMVSGFWREDDAEDVARIERAMSPGSPPRALADAQSAAFLAAWRCALGNDVSCAAVP